MEYSINLFYNFPDDDESVAEEVLNTLDRQSEGLLHGAQTKRFPENSRSYRGHFSFGIYLNPGTKY